MEYQIEEQIEKQLFKVIKSGNLEEMQSMYAKNPNIITLPQIMFRTACVDGYLHIAKWLLQVNPEIDISDKNEQAFRFACDFNHLHIAKWLLQVKPNINTSVFKDVAFYCACFEDRTQVAQWLHQIRPYHYILEVNQKNQIIHHEVRPITERKWLERRELLMSHYNKKEQKDVFWHLPKVLVIHICKYV